MWATSVSIYTCTWCYGEQTCKEVAGSAQQAEAGWLLHRHRTQRPHGPQPSFPAGDDGAAAARSLDLVRLRSQRPRQPKLGFHLLVRDSLFLLLPGPAPGHALLASVTAAPTPPAGRVG